MPVYAFSRQKNKSTVSYLGTNNGIEAKKNAYIFCASLQDKSEVSIVKNLLSNIYMDAASILSARKMLETLIGQNKHKTITDDTNLTTFVIWICIPLELPNITFTHDPVLQHELMITNEKLEESFINHIVTQMAQNGFPIFVARSTDGKQVEDSMFSFKKNIYLSFTPLI